MAAVTADSTTLLSAAGDFKKADGTTAIDDFTNTWFKKADCPGPAAAGAANLAATVAAAATALYAMC